MSAPKLPALRMTAEGNCIIEEGVSLDLPSSNKFSVSYAPFEGRQNSLGGSSTTIQDPMLSSVSDGERHQVESDLAGEFDISSRAGLGFGSQTTLNILLPDLSSIQDRPSTHMSRTLSMPLPSQLSQLQNPHRPGLYDIPHSKLTTSTTFTQSKQVREVSVELADSIQLVIQTLLQISPPQVLDPAREQFSACALSVPTSSMSALFTAMKNINYISANMSSFCEYPSSRPEELESVAKEEKKASLLRNEFDIGEMIQCVGDALSGAAAQSGVDLVIYHGDVGLKHVYVSGDESGISFVLSHIVRQVLDTAERGDSIELGLLVSPISTSAPGLLDSESPPVDDMLTAAPLESNGPIRITIRISHKYSPSETRQGTEISRNGATTEIRPKPCFSTLLLRRILRQIDGSLTPDLPPPEAFASGRTCDLAMILERAPIPISAHNAGGTDAGNDEPSLEQLTSFGETLKGKRVTLYAHAKGSFAHHLTSYLTAWGMDVTHVSPDGEVDGMTHPEDARMSSYSQLLATYPEGTPPELIKAEQRQGPPEKPSFIVIDDNIDILKERLQALRFETHPPLTANSKTRPSLSSTGRTRSTSNMARYLGINNASRTTNPVVIMHFTSLSNYKVVRDAMQSVTLSYNATGTPLPEVMIIPKPAGPRRFLTALHTAVTKPTVDPLFMPIATSPASPGIQHAPGSFFASPTISEYSSNSANTGSHGSPMPPNSPANKNANRPLGARTSSDRSTRSSNEPHSASQIPPSPLALPDNVEYFSAAAQKLGSSPSSGLVIQSPDGHTAGIYFHPRSKNSSRTASSQLMERDRGQLTLPASTRGSTPRVPSGGKKDDTVTFASLHEARKSRPSLDASSSSFSPTSPAAASPKVSSPRSAEEPEERLSHAPPILSPAPRRKSDESRKLASPPTGGSDATGTTSRRNTKRSDTKDSIASTSRRAKSGVMSDANVVPPISVLIVDDNPINQTILSTFMRRKRIKYDLASNGQEAVQKWRTGEFHLILMDIQMPVMDGIQATKEIRRLEKVNSSAGYPPLSPSTEGGNTPSGSTTSESKSLNSPYRSSVIIVALTASSLQSDRVAALAAGCNDFLTKPVSLLWLNNKIIEWGSIKALQMWADLRPDAMTSMQSGQATQARNIADRLYVPDKARVTPPPIRRPTSILEDNAAALALASSAGSVPNILGSAGTMQASPTASYFKIPERSVSTSSQLSEPNASSSFGTLKLAPVTRKSLEVDDDDDTPKSNTPRSSVQASYINVGRSNSRSLTPVQLRASDLSPPFQSSSTVEPSKTRGNGHNPPLEQYDDSSPSTSLQTSPRPTEVVNENSP